MEKDTHFKKCDVRNKQCTMDFFKDTPKLKTHIINLNRLSYTWNYFDTCEDDKNNSSCKRHVKKHKAILPNADSVSHADFANEN